MCVSVGVCRVPTRNFVPWVMVKKGASYCFRKMTLARVFEVDWEERRMVGGPGRGVP